MKKYIQLLSLALVAGAVYLPAQCPTVQNCPAPGTPVDLCDFTANNPLLWNETYWLDAATMEHNLADAPAELTVTATNTCTAGPDVTVNYLLFLDLDGNGTQETVVDSKNLPAPGTVAYNNAGNPNYSGGEVRSFDKRPVPPQEKWQFALETVVNGAVKTGTLRWQQQSAPGVFETPELPYGTHLIRWIVEDPQGAMQACEYQLVARDCKKPTVVCLNGLSVNIMPTGMITLWAVDFLAYAEDNHTPNSQLLIGIRKAGTGTGFPVDGAGNPLTSVTYTCDEQGIREVEVWCRDLAGNADFCQTYVLVQDNMGNCPVPGGTPLVCVGGGIEDFDVVIEPVLPTFPPVSLVLSNDQGCVQINPGAVPFNGDFIVSPVKDDNPLNGVSTFDLVLISRHILLTEQLDSPYKVIAADANRSGFVTAFDMVELRRLILGVYQELPANTSWRFVRADYVFPNPQLPFQPAFPESVVISPAMIDSTYNFVAIKVGDVNNTAIGNLLPEDAADQRAPLGLELPDLRMGAGESFDLALRPGEAGEWAALQAALRFDSALVEVEAVYPGDVAGLDEESFARPEPGLLNLAWFMPRPETLRPENVLLKLRLRARTAVRLRDAIRLDTERLAALAFSAEGEARALELKFNGLSMVAGTVLPQPNPTAGGTSFPLQLDEAATVTLQVTDLAGREVYGLRQELPAGNHQLDVPAAALDQTGFYIWRLQAGERVESGKLSRL
jgi:hypothetical protein